MMHVLVSSLCLLLWTLVEVHSQPTVSVSLSNTGTLYAGTGLTLTCTVVLNSSVDDSVNVMNVQWSGGSVGHSASVTESETTHSGVTSVRTLTFHPLNTSHGAEYTCQAEITIPSISVTKTSSESRAVIVQSKHMHHFQ